MKFTKLSCFSQPYFLISEGTMNLDSAELLRAERALIMLDKRAEIIFLSPSVKYDFKIRMYSEGSVAAPSYLSGSLVAAYYLTRVAGLPLSEYEIETEVGVYNVRIDGSEFVIKLPKYKRIFTKIEEMPDGVEIKYSVAELDERYAVMQCETFPPSDKDRLGAMLCRAANARAAVFVLRGENKISVYTEAGYAPLADLRAGAAAFLSGLAIQRGGEYPITQNNSEAVLFFSGGAFYIRHSPRVLHLGNM